MREVSVIIPTYNDWSRLSACLIALGEQAYPKEKFEIIVVNNNPKDVVPPNFFKPENCAIISEIKPGSYSARNAALKIAKGEILAFTDSDCIPDKDWIKNAVLLFEKDPGCSRIAGHIELFYKNDKLTLAELYEKVYAFKQDFAARKGASVTGNMFALKKVFDTIGDFNDSLMSGGDYEWSMRAQAAHFKIRYGKEVIVHHPARDQFDELLKKSKRLGAFYGKSKAKSMARLAKYSIPPINSLFHANRMNVTDRIRVMVARYYLNLARSLEEVKIAFGKKANRI